MFAVVARTASASGAFAARGRALRVTHTLLFSVALIVSPGVCGACASGCPDGGNAVADSPGTGVASAVAATHGRGSCCGAIPDGLPQGSNLRGDSPTGVADAADGFAGSCCRGATGCDCLLEPRPAEAAVPPATSPSEVGGPMPAAIAVLPLASVAPVAGAVAVAMRPPERPVRVLYGVWRN
ncbi:MAG: hypothetical protein ACKO1M_02420 [Planctomycetota bacterium]